MLGIARRKVLRQSLHRIRPAASLLRETCLNTKDEVLFLEGNTSFRSISNWTFPGSPIYTKPTRRGINVIHLGSSNKWIRQFASESGDSFDAVVPYMGESITDGILAALLKKPGDTVDVDEAIAHIETDKVTIDVASREAGVLLKYVASEGDTVTPGTKIAVISKSASATHAAPSEQATTKSDKPPVPPVKEDKPKSEPVAKLPPKVPSPPPSRVSAAEPQLPPKERERRVPMTRLRKRVVTRLKD